MLTENPVLIPDIPEKISFMKKDGKEYVRYLTKRKYNPDKRYTQSDWVLIGRRIEDMPRLMYPNDHYETIFCRGGENMDETMTAEEEQYIRDNGIYGMYSSFFTGLYNEFRQQTRKKADDPINRYKAENINKVLTPLREMMKGEEYAELLGLISVEETKDEQMNYGDVMILLTQYKSALAKYHRSHM